MYWYNGYPYFAQQVPMHPTPQQYPQYIAQQQRQPQRQQQPSRQSEKPSVQEIMQTIRTQHSNLYTQLEQAGVNRQLAETFIF